MSISRTRRLATSWPTSPLLIRSAPALLVLGCSSDTESDAADNADGGKAGSTGGPTTETSGTTVWKAPSGALSCGEPCSDAAPDETGVCFADVAARCVDGTVVCDECPATGRSCEIDDELGARCIRECEGTEICPAGEECFLQMCCPNTRWCERNAMAICDNLGTAVARQPCLAGLDCTEGQCRPAQTFIHVLFDTSGSMNWTPAGREIGAGAPGFPECDDPSFPQSRLGISKKAFGTLFADSEYESTLFALQRFPQRLLPDAFPRCPGGAYDAQNVITGGGSAGFTVGPWFERNLSEAIVVPFPRRSSDNNRDILSQWLDFEETLIITEEPCTQHDQCPGGLCTRPGSEGVCRYFENPELRAPSSATPLGTSLFYAGEYIRSQVVVEGLECTLDSDCGAAHHLCENDVCTDPNRRCRQRSVVVFSDGVDTASPTDWLDPVVQARRFRAGLDCQTGGDCSKGFECVSGVCHPEGATQNNPCSLLAGSHYCSADSRSFPEATQLGVRRLRDRTGAVIDVTVHMIDGSGHGLASSEPIAAYGGGLWIAAQLADPTSLVAELRPVIDWKDPKFCTEE